MLRAHQIRGARAALRQFEFGGRATVVLPGGGGKTVLGAAVVEGVGGPLSLVVAPTLALVDQTFGEYRRWAGLAREDAMLVCHATRHRGVARSTKAGDVARFVSARPEARKVVLSTYRSLPVVAAALRAAGRRFDVGVFDEAHVTTFRGRAGGLATEGAGLDCARRLYLTATPRLTMRRGGGDKDDDTDAKSGFGAGTTAFAARSAARSMGDDQSSKRVIQFPFNMSVLEATPERKASTLRVRPER